MDHMLSFTINVTTRELSLHTHEKIVQDGFTPKAGNSAKNE